MSKPAIHLECEPLGEPSGSSIDPAKMPGHWLLARLGKRVLRPGGLEMTRRMLAELAIGPDDHIVEFAPGLGVTAQMTLRRRPASYTAVERDQDAAREVRRWLGRDESAQRVITGCAQDTGLPGESATIVYGEAMLSMQTESRKRAIMGEALRLLRPGGRYAVHELCLTPDDLPCAEADAIRKSVTQAIRHQAVPLTAREWRERLASEGFEVMHCSTAPMMLLEPTRMVRDEGMLRMARILWRLMRDSASRARVIEMRRVFRTHREHLAAICLIARKP